MSVCLAFIVQCVIGELKYWVRLALDCAALPGAPTVTQSMVTEAGEDAEIPTVSANPRVGAWGYWVMSRGA